AFSAAISVLPSALKKNGLVTHKNPHIASVYRKTCPELYAPYDWSRKIPLDIFFCKTLNSQPRTPRKIGD
ncbi:MAG: hypothetical protein V4487_02510, partial [Chlamydiota bacterium]